MKTIRKIRIFYVLAGDAIVATDSQDIAWDIFDRAENVADSGNSVDLIRGFAPANEMVDGLSELAGAIQNGAKPVMKADWMYRTDRKAEQDYFKIASDAARAEVDRISKGGE